MNISSWDGYAYESNQGDLVVRHFPVLRENGTWVPDQNGNPANRTLWLERGGLAQAAPAFWARADQAEMVGLPGFEPGSNAPKASSIDQTNPQARGYSRHLRIAKEVD